MASLEGAPAHESKLYSELAYVYDLVFTRFFEHRIKALVRKLDIPPGAKVLEVGVGTGLSFEAYPVHCQVTGIDLAPEMLEKAENKIHRHGWRHIKVLEMDAMNLKFPDDSFDYTMAFHVVTVVPDVEKLMAEVVRVTKPGGTVAIINHFRSQNRFLAAGDLMMEPIYRRLGWHTLSLDQVIGRAPIDVTEKYKTSRNSLFTIVLGKNRK
jgi:phosphatidylethanolamine/phosphatidyl-N-methylethanolamine N-methyltransferase